MPVTAKSLLLVLVMSFTLYGCNHKPLAKPTIIIPDDVNSYVINNEKQVANLKPNTQKKIFWYTAVNKKSEYSIVFIHGFAGSRLVQEPALSNLAHKFKANYFATRIRGHGQPSQHIHEATAENWLYDTQEALEIGKKIGKKVIVVCHSTGCPALIKQLSEEPQEYYHSAILLSPNYGPKNTLSEALLWPGGLDLAKKIHGPKSRIGKSKLNKEEIKLKKLYQNRIDATATEIFPLEAVQHVMHVVNQARNIDNSSIRIPMLIIYSKHDLSVSHKLIDKYTNKYHHAKISKIYTAPNSLDVSNHIHIGQFSDPSANKAILKLMQKFINHPEKSFSANL